MNYFPLHRFRSCAALITLLHLGSLHALHADALWDFNVKYAPGNPSGVVWDPNDAKPATDQAIADARIFFQSPSNAAATLTLRYPPGTIVFKDPNPSGAQFTTTNKIFTAIPVANFTPGTSGRLVIQGCGQANTTLLIEGNWRNTEYTDSSGVLHYSRGPQRAFWITNSQRITLKNFELKSSHLTVTQGSVVGVGPGYLNLRIHSGFPRPDTQAGPNGPGLLAGYCHTAGGGLFLRRYTTSTTNPFIDTTTEQIAWESVSEMATPGDFHFVLSLPNYTPPYLVNEVIGIKIKHGVDIYRFQECSDLRFEDLRLTGKTRGLFLQCENTYVGGPNAGLRVDRPIVGGRTACLSSPEGGPQFSATVGGLQTTPPTPLTSGLVVDNCRIIGTGDDCIALFLQQNFVVKNNYVRDSFARGLLFSDCPNVPSDTALQDPNGLNNTALRAPILRITNP